MNTSEITGNKKLRVALVGLGMYSTGQLAPALQLTKHCALAGIVTGSPEKAEQWRNRYSLPEKNCYNYQNFELIKDNTDIDIVYVVLPNSMHAEFVIKAAKAGKHVICEKPMGISAKECEAMIQACKDAGTMLSIGYRLHFEPFNQEMMRLGQEKIYGTIRKIKAYNGMDVSPGTWRTDKELAGGGPLMDLGIYCIQGAIYTIGKLPVAITAQEGDKTDPETFREVEQSITWQMEFSGEVIADCHTSYADSMNLLRAEAENGWFELSPAYEYGGLKGNTSDGLMNFENINQQQRQMDDFAMCILNGKKSKVPGEMGLRDVKILTAIYEATKSGQRIELDFAREEELTAVNHYQ